MVVVEIVVMADVVDVVVELVKSFLCKCLLYKQ